MNIQEIKNKLRRRYIRIVCVVLIIVILVFGKYIFNVEA